MEYQPPAATSEDVSFHNDDLEFRTVTTILAHLRRFSPPTIKSVQADLSLSQRSYLKILSILSSLLVRNYEVVAVLPNLSPGGLKLIITTQLPEELVGDVTKKLNFDEGDMYGRFTIFVMQNPSNHEASCNEMTLLNMPAMYIDLEEDILVRVIKNWSMPFEFHVKTIEILVSTCLNADDSCCQYRLTVYALLQSAPKIKRRFNLIKFPLNLQDDDFQDPADMYCPKFSQNDINTIRTIAYFGYLDFLAYPLLNDIVHKGLPDRDQILSRGVMIELYSVLVGLLNNASEAIDALYNIRDCKEPPSLSKLKETLSPVYQLLTLLRIVAWGSQFFYWFITKYLSTAISRYSSDTEPESQNTCSSAIADDSDGGPDMEASNIDFEEDSVDIPNEYEEGEETQDYIQDHVRQSAAEILIRGLRVTTSTIQHIYVLALSGRRWYKKLPSISFQVIQCPCPDKDMKPWRTVISELFPDGDDLDQVLTTLDVLGQKYPSAGKFRKGYRREMKFSGRPHCEALLGCAYFLAKSGREIKGISNDVLKSVQYCFNLVAPSKRCCPICFVLLAELNRNYYGTGIPNLQVLGQHSIIFPYAFPVGLPRPVREILLAKYKSELKDLLRNLLPERRLSTDSAQSDVLSIHANDISGRAIDHLIAFFAKPT